MTSIAESAPTPGRAAAAVKPSPERYGPLWRTVLFLSDILVFTLAAEIACALRLHMSFLHVRPDLQFAMGLGAAIWFALFAAVGLYSRAFADSPKDEFYRIAAALLIGAVPELLIYTLVPALSPSRSTLLVFLAGALVLAPLSHAGLEAFRSRHFKRKDRRTAIVGRRDRVADVVARLAVRRRETIVRFPVADFDAEISRGDWPWLEAAIAWGAERIIVTEIVAGDIMPDLLSRTAEAGIELAFAPTRIRPQAYELTLEREGGLVLIRPRRLAICTPGVELFRRTVDLAVALPLLVLLAPILTLLAIVIKLDSPGPAIFRQTRTGKNGRSFEMLKFRSMPVDIESKTGPRFAHPTESHVTRIGRFIRRTSLDELPQIVNVLRGEMALIGPRPERPLFVERFREELARYDERHLVAPGITGWAQITMRRILTPADAHEKLAGDLYYIENWSPLMDFTIIVKTAAEFLFHRVA
jgi:exopolysaccharide biosynthesis polyprenyl glycosylphosphotransferase